MHRRVIAIAAALLIATTPSAASATAPPDSTAGPLFFPSLLGLGPALHLPHYCSASVVHSAHRDLVLTAAHCVFGTGFGIEFAPGFHDGISPYGVWSVRRVYLDDRWRTSHDPHHDFAFLQVAERGGRNIEDVTGSRPLGGAPSDGTKVTVTGYPARSDGSAVRCTADVYYTSGYPTFNCAGFVDGVSGGPWIADDEVVGVIGGLDQGGCTPDTSYSPPFGPDVEALRQRAERGGTGDLAPLPSASGC